jgi:LPXTG-motif cell wall-anchored protein
MTPAEGNDTDGYKKVTGTAKITQTETLYIANVPVNTHYTIKETGLAALGYQLIDIQRQVGTNDPAPGAGNIENGIEGEIVQNTETLITYTNKCLVADINIQKVDEKGKGLEGAVFQLKKMNGLEKIDASTIESVSGLEKITKEIDGKTVEYTSAFETTGGVQTIKGLPNGTYRLREVYVPPGYVSSYKYIEFTVADRQITNVTTDNGETTHFVWPVKSDNTSIQIINEPGVELPHTGGIGTTIFYIFGAVLVVGCSVVLAARRRLKKTN